MMWILPLPLYILKTHEVNVLQTPKTYQMCQIEYNFRVAQHK